MLTLVWTLGAAGCALSGVGRPPALDAAQRVALARYHAALAARVAPAAVAPGDPDVRRFDAAYGLMLTYHVDPLAPAALIDAAIGALDDPSAGDTVAGLVAHSLDAMVAAGDPHGSYLSPEIYAELQVDTRGSFGAVGLELARRDGVLTIVAPIEGAPAERAGLVAGDRLLAIDGMPTADVGLVPAVRALRGPVDSVVSLTVQRPGMPDPVTHTIAREVVSFRLVVATRLDQQRAHVRVTRLHERTQRELLAALAALRSEGPLDGVVLDLRNNSGGLLSQSVLVADVFLATGVIAETRGRTAADGKVFRAQQPSDWHELPLVVVVDHGTAAGAEIIAAALQAQRRAPVIGTATAGRDTIQTILPLSDDAALKLTTQRVVGPTGTPLEHGVQPDVRYDADPAAVPSAADPVIGAAAALLSAPPGD